MRSTDLVLNDEPAHDEHDDADAENPWTWAEWSGGHDSDDQEPHTQQLERTANVVNHQGLLGPFARLLTLSALQFAPGAQAAPNLFLVSTRRRLVIPPAY